MKKVKVRRKLEWRVAIMAKPWARVRMGLIRLPRLINFSSVCLHPLLLWWQLQLAKMLIGYLLYLLISLDNCVLQMHLYQPFYIQITEALLAQVHACCRYGIKNYLVKHCSSRTTQKGQMDHIPSLPMGDQSVVLSVQTLLLHINPVESEGIFISPLYIVR